MNISNYYWYFWCITPRFCDDVIPDKRFKQKETMAITGGYGKR